jgi:hypothetical protein
MSTPARPRPVTVPPEGVTEYAEKWTQGTPSTIPADQDQCDRQKSGRTFSVPVWFALEGHKLYLLPLRGSDTEWYKNVLHTPRIRISARDEEADFQVAPVTDAKAVKSVVEKFREKYGAKDVKKYYSKFDVAVLVKLA